ncbi:MAG TPA: tetratricopeptide repeat protein [Phycisphaerae bacterium]|nr:tetratricopeptide repeat protein [Phycisphaerae bacterium]
MAHEVNPAPADEPQGGPSSALVPEDGPDIGLEAQPEAALPRQAVLVGGVLLLVGAVVATVWLLAVGAREPSPAPVQPTVAPASVGTVPPPTREPPAPPEALSLTVAEKACADGDYTAALDCYRRLIAKARLGGSEEADADLVLDFLVLRLAQAQLRAGRTGEAKDQLNLLTDSRSPLVRGLACFQVAVLDLEEGQYLSARTQAYRALAILGASQKGAQLESACDFLVAVALSRKALVFYSRDADLPAPVIPESSLFSTLHSEDELRRVLSDGVDRLAGAALGPKLDAVVNGKAGPRWTVACGGAPVEELLCRLTGSANVNIVWKNVDPAARDRPLFMYGDKLSDQRVIEVACGTVGLMARLSGTEVTIHDPQGLASTADLRDLLLREAVSAWRRLLLRSSDAEQFAYGHFALGLLYECQNDKAGAMTEYQVLAGQFPRSSLSPLGRLRNASIRIDFKDYAGARQELLELLNRHPAFQATDQVYLRLGEATMEAGLTDEAVATFKKLFDLEPALPVRLAACLKAGACCYRKADYEAAARWLGRYIDLSAGRTGDEPAQAALLLARSQSALGRFEPASAALTKALEAEPSEALRVDILLELARTLMRQDELAMAIAVVESIRRDSVPADKADEAVLLHAQILRAVGLADKAAMQLQAQMASATSDQNRARMAIELARCHIDAGKLMDAHRQLAAVLTDVGTGPLAIEAACELAEVCLKVGQADHAVSVCQHALSLPLPDATRRRLLNILGVAHVRMRDYDRAALAFSALAPEAKGAATP